MIFLFNHLKIWSITLLRRDEISSTKRLLEVISGSGNKETNITRPSSRLTPVAKKAFTLFPFIKKYTLGIDIGDNSLKIVRILHVSDHNRKLAGCAVIPFSFDISVKNKHCSDFLKSVLKPYWNSSNTKIWVLLPQGRVETHYLKIPKISKKNFYQIAYLTYKKNILMTKITIFLILKSWGM